MAVRVSSLNARRALEALGANIKTARLKRRISVKGFAERVGVSQIFARSSQRKGRQNPGIGQSVPDRIRLGFSLLECYQYSASLARLRRAKYDGVHLSSSSRIFSVQKQQTFCWNTGVTEQ